MLLKKEVSSSNSLPDKTSQTTKTSLGRGARLISFVLVGVCAAFTPFAENPGLALLYTMFTAILLSPLWLFPKPRPWYHPLHFFLLTRLVQELPRVGYYFGFSEPGALAGYAIGLPRAELVSASALFLCGSIAAVMSYFVGVSFSLTTGPRMLVPRTKSSRCSAVAGAALFAASMAVAAYFIWSRGGIANHFLRWSFDARLAEEASLAGKAYLPWLGSLHAPLLLLFISSGRVSLRSRLGIFLALSSTIMLFLVNAGNRGSLIYFVAALTIVTIIRSPAKKALKSGLSVVVLAMVLFAGLGIGRRVLGNESGWSAVATMSGETSMVATASGAMAEYQLQLRDHVVFGSVLRTTPLVLGSTYLSIPANPIPRLLWPEKPPFTDFVAAQTFWGLDWGLPIGAVAEAFWNWWWPGVFLVFWLFGVWHRVLLEWIRGREDDPFLAAIFGVSIVMLWEPYSSDIIKYLRFIIPLIFLSYPAGLRIALVRTNRRS